MPPLCNRIVLPPTPNLLHLPSVLLAHATNLRLSTKNIYRPQTPPALAFTHVTGRGASFAFWFSVVGNNALSRLLERLRFDHVLAKKENGLRLIFERWG